MSVEIHPSGGGVRFYYTEIYREFGPVMTDFEEAERFNTFLGGKPESYSIAHLEILYENWNKAIGTGYQDGWDDCQKQRATRELEMLAEVEKIAYQNGWNDAKKENHAD